MTIDAKLTNRERIERLRKASTALQSGESLELDFDDMRAVLALLDEWEKALIEESKQFKGMRRKSPALVALALLDRESP